MSELSLWLDNYDDIYSDFDSRHYQKRRVSEDFLYELKIELKTKLIPEDTLVLFLPEQNRSSTKEKVISESLASYFIAQFRLHIFLCRKKIKSGLLFLAAGMTLMIINSIISHTGKDSMVLTSIKILLEPAGWFFLWTALESLFYELREMKKDRNLFKILAGMNIIFRSSGLPDTPPA